MHRHPLRLPSASTKHRPPIPRHRRRCSRLARHTRQRPAAAFQQRHRSRSNPGENSRLVFAKRHLPALAGLAKVSTKAKDHQWVEVEPRHPLAFGPDRVQRLWQKSTQRSLGRDRCAPRRRAGSLERTEHAGQGCARDPTDHPRRVPPPNPARKSDMRKQAASPLVPSTQRIPPPLHRMNRTKTINARASQLPVSIRKTSAEGRPRWRPCGWRAR